MMMLFCEQDKIFKRHNCNFFLYYALYNNENKNHIVAQLFMIYFVERRIGLNL